MVASFQSYCIEVKIVCFAGSNWRVKSEYGATSNMTDGKDVIYRVVARQKGRTGKLVATILLSVFSIFGLGLIRII